MSLAVPYRIAALEAMRRYPQPLYYRGNLSLLKRPIVSVVGTRRPSGYTKEVLSALVKALRTRGVCIVSGAAMGCDATAHLAAGSDNTIAVLGCGLDLRYPAVNASMIAEIERNGLLLSPFEEGFRATQWSFVQRNEIVVALGEVLVIAQADEKSGSMHSAAYAQAMGKPIFVLPQRIGESDGTNRLLSEGKAEAIYDIEVFASRFGHAVSDDTVKDDFFYFCQSCPSLDEAVARFGARVYEAELEGKICISQGKVYVT